MFKRNIEAGFQIIRAPGERVCVRSPPGVPADLQSAVKKVRPIKTGGFVIPQQKEMHSPLLRISNPQSLNRLGHFLTPDFKSGGTPGGLAFLFYIRRDAKLWHGMAIFCLLKYGNPNFPETFLPFSLHFQNKSLSLQPTRSRTLK